MLSDKAAEQLIEYQKKIAADHAIINNRSYVPDNYITPKHRLLKPQPADREKGITPGRSI